METTNKRRLSSVHQNRSIQFVAKKRSAPLNKYCYHVFSGLTKSNTLKDTRIADAEYFQVPALNNIWYLVQSNLVRAWKWSPRKLINLNLKFKWHAMQLDGWLIILIGHVETEAQPQLNASTTRVACFSVVAHRAPNKKGSIWYRRLQQPGRKPSPLCLAQWLMISVYLRHSFLPCTSHLPFYQSLDIGNSYCISSRLSLSP